MTQLLRVLYLRRAVFPQSSPLKEQRVRAELYCGLGCVAVESITDEFHKILVRYGFKDQPDIPAALELCASSGLKFNTMETSYFLSRQTLVPKLGKDMALWREKLFALMSRNSASAISFFKLPANRVVELGTRIEL